MPDDNFPKKCHALGCNVSSETHPHIKLFAFPNKGDKCYDKWLKGAGRSSADSSCCLCACHFGASSFLTDNRDLLICEAVPICWDSDFEDYDDSPQDPWTIYSSPVRTYARPASPSLIDLPAPSTSEKADTYKIDYFREKYKIFDDEEHEEEKSDYIPGKIYQKKELDDLLLFRDIDEEESESKFDEGPNVTREPPGNEGWRSIKENMEDLHTSKIFQENNNDYTQEEVERSINSIPKDDRTERTHVKKKVIRSPPYRANENTLFSEEELINEIKQEAHDDCEMVCPLSSECNFETGGEEISILGDLADITSSLTSEPPVDVLQVIHVADDLTGVKVEDDIEVPTESDRGPLIHEDTLQAINLFLSESHSEILADSEEEHTLKVEDVMDNLLINENVAESEKNVNQPEKAIDIMAIEEIYLKTEVEEDEMTPIIIDNDKESISDPKENSPSNDTPNENISIDGETLQRWKNRLKTQLVKRPSTEDAEAEDKTDKKRRKGNSVDMEECYDPLEEPVTTSEDDTVIEPSTTLLPDIAQSNTDSPPEQIREDSRVTNDKTSLQNISEEQRAKAAFLSRFNIVAIPQTQMIFNSNESESDPLAKPNTTGSNFPSFKKGKRRLSKNVDAFFKSNVICAVDQSSQIETDPLVDIVTESEKIQQIYLENDSAKKERDFLVTSTEIKANPTSTKTVNSESLPKKCQKNQEDCITLTEKNVSSTDNIKGENVENNLNKNKDILSSCFYISETADSVAPIGDSMVYPIRNKIKMLSKPSTSSLPVAEVLTSENDTIENVQDASFVSSSNILQKNSNLEKRRSSCSNEVKMKKLKISNKRSFESCDSTVSPGVEVIQPDFLNCLEQNSSFNNLSKALSRSLDSFENDFLISEQKKEKNDRQSCEKEFPNVKDSSHHKSDLFNGVLGDRLKNLEPKQRFFFEKLISEAFQLASKRQLTVNSKILQITDQSNPNSGGTFSDFLSTLSDNSEEIGINTKQ